jgi:multidrug efflux pump subunit AcrA (membrane-fusion protein)
VRPDADVFKAFGQPPAPAAAKGDASSGTVWQVVNGALTPLRVKTGATDGMVTEVVDTPLVEGTPVVTRVSLATEPAARPASSSSPLMPSQPQRRF